MGLRDVVKTPYMLDEGGKAMPDPQLQRALDLYLRGSYLGPAYLSSHPPARLSDMAGFEADLAAATRDYSAQAAQLRQAAARVRASGEEVLERNRRGAVQLSDQENWYCQAFDNIKNVDATTGDGQIWCNSTCCHFPHQTHMRGNIGGGPLVVRELATMMAQSPTLDRMSCSVPYTTPTGCSKCQFVRGCELRCTCGDSLTEHTLDLSLCYAPGAQSAPHTCVDEASTSGIANCEVYGVAPHMVDAGVDLGGRLALRWEGGPLMCPERPLHSTLKPCPLTSYAAPA